jgi:hypothetical protein
MNIAIVDYSEFYYSSMLKTDLPDVRSGKFVQIRNDDTEYLVFSPAQLTPYHAGLIERFCLEAGLEGSYDSERKRYNIHDPAWVIVGGGKFEIDRIKETVRLYDDSMAYGKFDSEGLKEKIMQIEGMCNYKVSIE